MRRTMLMLSPTLLASTISAQPYDFTDADALLQASLAQLENRVAVIVRQNGTEIYRFQSGSIGYDTLTRMASFTKTVSAAVVLSMRDDGLWSLDERIGDSLPGFEANGLGDPTILDCWAMRHGVDSTIAYEHNPNFTLAQSVTLIGANGFLEFAPGTQLGYDGAGMQTVGRMAELRTGESWETVARSRIFDRCDMPLTDYEQFAPNPSVPGGLRSTPNESMNFAQMIIDGGVYNNERVLSEESIEQLFTNETRGLPVFGSPWAPTHPNYPYGVDPDYSFGAWVLAENPESAHVEEIVGAGAWGSFLWLDRRRGVSAVFFTDVPAGTQQSRDPALELLSIVRREIDGAQATGLVAAQRGLQIRLTWTRAPGSSASIVYGSNEPIRNIYDLRSATSLGATSAAAIVVPAFAHYAVVAVHPTIVNVALTPGGNTLTEPAPCPGDANGDRRVDFGDLNLLLSNFGESGNGLGGDLNGDSVVNFADLNVALVAFGQPCP